MSRPCRSTQHCAFHGWCHRCDSEFADLMDGVNEAIHGVVGNSQWWGLLYAKIGRTLHRRIRELRKADTDARRRDKAARWVSSDQNELREQVREALGEAGLSQAEACRRLGVSTKYMSEMLTGKAPLTLAWAARILDSCGMRLELRVRPIAQRKKRRA